MNQRVCYETAKKLKDIGFPQPKFAEEQIWYDQSGKLWRTIKWSESSRKDDLVLIGDYLGDWDIFPKTGQNLIFAPTAIDILKELNQKSFKSWFMLGFDSAGFECAEYSIGGRINEVYHENSAEACAEMLLEYENRGKKKM